MNIPLIVLLVLLACAIAIAIRTVILRDRRGTDIGKPGSSYAVRVISRGTGGWPVLHKPNLR